MALPDYFKVAQGTAVIWGESGATGGLGAVTKTLSLNALASGSGRMGASADLGATWDMEHILIGAIESGTAPTAGLSIDIYLAWSHDNTNWPAGVTGSDGAWPADGNEDEWALQLTPIALSVISTNDGNVVQMQNPRIIIPKARYVAPVVDNNWNQAIRNQGTASNNLSRILLVPLISSVED
jgi:hypothetical protein